MKRIDTSTRALNLFGAGKDGFKDGDLANGIAPTDLNAQWFNQVQEEVANLVETAGLVLNAGDLTQVVQAIRLLTPGRLLRTLVYKRIAGVQNVSINGGAFTTVGASTYTPSVGMSFTIAEVQGGGASGAGGTAPSTAGNVSMGAPGTSGAVGRGYYSAAAIGASQAITVGAGGTGVSGAAGNAGGASSLGALLTAAGGIVGGLLNNFAATPLANGNGNLTAVPAGANIFGSSGSCDFQSLIVNAGSASGLLPGTGGRSIYGIGGFGALNATPAAAASPGSGGGGSLITFGTAATAGGAGAAGQIIIQEFA